MNSDGIIENVYGKVVVKFYRNHYLEIWKVRQKERMYTFGKQPIKDHPYLGKSIRHKDKNDTGIVEWVGQYWYNGGYFNQCLINYNGSHTFFIINGENHPDPFIRNQTEENKNQYVLSETNHPNFKYRNDLD